MTVKIVQVVFTVLNKQMLITKLIPVQLESTAQIEQDTQQIVPLEHIEPFLEELLKLIALIALQVFIAHSAPLTLSSVLELQIALKILLTLKLAKEAFIATFKTTIKLKSVLRTFIVQEEHKIRFHALVDKYVLSKVSYQNFVMLVIMLFKTNTVF
jgi:hypothetical protein